MVLVVAGATIAASPSASPGASPAASGSPASSPAPKPSAPPTASPAPSKAPTSSSTGSGASTAPTTWTAAIKPLNATTGSAKVVEHANGTGTLTVKLDGLDADRPWTVDVDAGTVDRQIERAADEIAFRAGMGVERVSNDTVRVHLTKTEMHDFVRAQGSRGVVVMVSDGTNRSAAAFPAAS
jgi:hypothetical protein